MDSDTAHVEQTTRCCSPSAVIEDLRCVQAFQALSQLLSALEAAPPAATTAAEPWPHLPPVRALCRRHAQLLQLPPPSKDGAVAALRRGSLLGRLLRLSCGQCPSVRRFAATALESLTAKGSDHKSPGTLPSAHAPLVAMDQPLPQRSAGTSSVLAARAPFACESLSQTYEIDHRTLQYECVADFGLGVLFVCLSCLEIGTDEQRRLQLRLAWQFRCYLPARGQECVPARACFIDARFAGTHAVESAAAALAAVPAAARRIPVFSAALEKQSGLSTNAAAASPLAPGPCVPTKTLPGVSGLRAHTGCSSRSRCRVSVVTHGLQQLSWLVQLGKDQNSNKDAQSA